MLHPDRSRRLVPAILITGVARVELGERHREHQPCSSSVTRNDPRVLNQRGVLHRSSTVGVNITNSAGATNRRNLGYAVRSIDVTSNPSRPATYQADA